MPRRVDPELYRQETPIFARLLTDREGRFPGTPHDEEDLPAVDLAITPVPLAESPVRLAPGLAPVPPKDLNISVFPVRSIPPEEEPEDGERTQPMECPEVS